MHGRKITVAAVMLLASAFISLPDAAMAQTRPATNLETTTLLSPATAWTYYGTDTTHTDGVGYTALRAPEIKALARGLGAERVGQPEATGGITADEFAQRVYDYVRNNIAVEFRFGLSKGARGALIDQSGTTFDQVHLMIELLREGGVTAGYRVGTVSMTAQEFGQWTGLIKGLVEQTSTVPQSFAVDAKAACQLLADGAIPGIVDSATTCSSLSGDLPATGSVVTLGHIWVSANGKFYDPSYKKYLFKEGIDLPAAMGCGTEAAPTCGDSATTAAMTGSTASTIGGSPAITNVNEAGLNSNLATKAATLQNYIQTNMVNGVTMDVIGGKQVDRSFSPIPSVTTLFPSTTQYSWDGEIPDQFRTKLRTRYAVFDQTFYGDEIAGKRIRILGYPQGTNPGWLLYLDSLRINTAACSTCSTTQVTLNIDHPYAAAAGLYSDEQVDMPLLASVTPNVPPITIVHGLGAAGPSTEQFYADLQKVDPHPVFYPNGYPKPGAPPDPMCGGGYVYNGNYYQRLELCRNDAQPTLIAKLLAQAGVAERITAEMGDAVVQRHHTIGMVASQATAPNSSDLLSVQSNISVTSRRGDANARMATFETTSAAWAMLEGSIAQQISDTWMPDSATSLIVMANRNSVPLINVTSAGMAALIPSLVGYNVNGRQTRLQQAATDGYNAIIPRNATPGAFSIGGVSFNWLVGGDLFYKADSVAYMINEAYKGGAAADGSEDPDEAVLNSAKAADYALNPKKFLTVSPASGEVTLDPRADLVTGAGSQSLSLQRSYRSNNGTFESMALVYGTTGGPSAYYRRFWTYSGPDTDVPGRVGSGWMHNFGVSARMGNNAMKAMSEDSALDSSAFVAGLFTLQDAVRNPTFQRRLTGIFTAQWLNDRFIRNAVTVDVAGKIEVFGKLPNGTYNPPPASASRLIQNGAPIGPRLLNAGNTVGYDYSPVTFVYTDREGAEIAFNWGAEWHTDRGVYMPPQFKPLTWTQPNGEKLTFTYEWKETHWTGYESLYVALIKSVSNNVGRTLTFTNNYRTVSTNPYDWIWRIERVTDETGRYVDYLPTNCPPLLNWSGGASQVLACNTFTASLQDGTISKYTYQAGTDSPDPVILTKPNFRLRRWFAPSNQTTALNTVAYDDLFRAKSVKDILTRETKYYTGSVSLGEYHKPAEVIDARNAINEYLYDERGSIIRGVDPLGRTTAYEYDDIGRLITTIYPEGNSLTQTYDVRSNVLEKRNVAKATPAAPDIVTSTTYVEGATVKTCVNPKTCNKPATETDARLQVTDYTWNATYGDLTQLRLPPDPLGVRPQTDYTYTLTGPTGLQYRAMTSKTEKISSSVSVVTNYAYNPANRYVLQSSTVDPSGLNLITGFTFDTRGNVTAVDGPRTDVVDVTNYVWDTQRRLTFEIGADPDAAGALLRPATRFSYNLDGLRTKTERGTTTTATGAPFTLLESSSFEYDALGNRTRENVMNGATANPLTVTQYSHDAVYQLQCTSQRMNPAVFSSLGSDACALGTAGTFGDDRITRFTYDLAGNKTIESRAFGTALQQDYASFTYTPNGKVATIRDAKNNRTTMEYDGQDRLARIRYPVEAAGADASVSAPNDIYDLCYDGGYTPPTGLGYEQYCFDANGNQTTLRRRDASILNFAYDNLNRETLKDIPGGTAADVYSGYDLLGRKLYARFASASGQGVDHSYDKAGRLITETTVGRAMAYQYDKAGNRTRVTWPDALYVDYTYDALNRTKELRENGATVAPGLLATYSYDNLGRHTGLTRGNAVTTSWGYDGASRLASLTQNPAGTTYDQTYGYSYTPASGISSRSASNDTYAYAGFSVGSTSYGAANGLNQYPTVGAAVFGYDNRANLTSDGVRTMAYDVENRLLSVNGGGASLDVAYDPLGRLSETSSTGAVTQFLFAGDALVAEYNSAGTLLRRYAHGAVLDEPLVWYEGSTMTDRRWLLGDERGSIIAETDGAGAASIYVYDAYGIPKNDIWTGSRFRYTGQIVLDAPAKLYHYKARVYDPKIGRFFQTDPIGYEDQLNLYAYVANDPVNGTDPTGTEGIVDGVVDWGTMVVNDLKELGSDIASGDFQHAFGGMPPTLGGGVVSSGATAIARAATVLKAEVTAARAVPAATRGGENAAAAAGRQAHKELAGKVAQKPGWKSEPRMIGADGKTYRPDVVTPRGRILELKPNTPSGQAAGARQTANYSTQLGAPARTITYQPPPPPPKPWWKIW